MKPTKEFIPLDDYERELKEEIDKGNFQPVENMQEEIKKYENFFKTATVEEIEGDYESENTYQTDSNINLEELKNDKDYNRFLEILHKEGLTYKEAFKRLIHKVAIGEVSLKMN